MLVIIIPSERTGTNEPSCNYLRTAMRCYALFQVPPNSVCSALAMENCDKTEPIDILTDARHGTRKDGRPTDVICLGNERE